MVCFRSQQKLHLYRAVDEQGQVIDVLFRDKRDRASADVVLRQAVARAEVTPQAVITDHHQLYMKAVATVLPLARYVRTSLPCRRGYTTEPIEGSHVSTRDRLRSTRGLRTVHTGHRCVASLEARHALRQGRVKLHAVVPTHRPAHATEHEAVRVACAALAV